MFAFQEHRMRQVSTVLQGIKWLSQIVRKTQVDILHSNHTAHLYSGPISRMTKIPELWHIHDYPYHPDALGKLILRLPVQHILFTTERIKSGYPMLKAASSIVAPTCVDPSWLRAIPMQEDIRKRYDLSGVPLLVTVTRLQEHKGLHYLIAAIPQILQACPDAKFAIVGKASSTEQIAYRERLLAQCATLGVAKNVSFLGYVPDEDLVALYHEAAALVHPATSEGYGLTLLEAMALGVPVIAAAADGPKEIIRHKMNGWLVPPADALSLAEAVIELLSKPELAKSLSTRGQEYADRMSLDAMVNQTVDVYRKMIGENLGGCVG